MGRIHLIIPDSHSHYEHNNDRADWLSKLIIDVSPDVVIHLGDSADMPSLSGYDKGHASFQGRTYEADIYSHLEFQERLWNPIRARKKKLPRSIFCVGNHEDRITRAIDIQPELSGTISLDDLQLPKWYDEVVWYSGRTPGIIQVDGIYYAHYFVGISGRAIGGERPGYAVLQKKHASCTYGHNHQLDWFIRSDPEGKKLMGLSAGCFFDYESDWAGSSNKLYSRGIAIKRNVENGHYDLQWISLDAIKKEYAAK